MGIRRLAGPRIMILAYLGAGQPECTAQAPLPPPSTAPSIQGSNSAQSIAAQIQGLASQISSLNEEITVLLTQLEHLRATKPQPPPNEASPAVKTAYANALQVWSNEMQSAKRAGSARLPSVGGATDGYCETAGGTRHSQEKHQSGDGRGCRPEAGSDKARCENRCGVSSSGVGSAIGAHHIFTDAIQPVPP